MKVRELQQWGGPRSHSRVPRLAAAASQGAERHGAGLYSADGRICKRAFPPFPLLPPRLSPSCLPSWLGCDLFGPWSVGCEPAGRLWSGPGGERHREMASFWGGLRREGARRPCARAQPLLPCFGAVAFADSDSSIVVTPVLKVPVPRSPPPGASESCQLCSLGGLCAALGKRD